MSDTLKTGSLLWYVTGWTGDGKPTRIESVPVLGQTPRRWVLKADDMLWKVPKSGGVCREARRWIPEPNLMGTLAALDSLVSEVRAECIREADEEAKGWRALQGEHHAKGRDVEAAQCGAAATAASVVAARIRARR